MPTHTSFKKTSPSQRLEKRLFIKIKGQDMLGKAFGFAPNVTFGCLPATTRKEILKLSKVFGLERIA